MQEKIKDEYTFDGKKTRMKVTNMLKEMGCVWFVVTDKESGHFTEWNMTVEQLRDLANLVERWKEEGKRRGEEK